MIRFAWLAARILAVMILAVWLSDHPGKVSINWQNYLIETSVGALLVIIVVLLGIFILTNRLLRDVMRIPRRWAQQKELETSRRGRKALTSGLAAVASGDAAAAKRLARQTEAAIVDPVLSHLLTAEALILSGETDAAESQFELLLGREDTRVIGHRGLIEVALARGDWARAYTRAKQARAIMPKSPWLFSLLIDLAVRAGDLADARQALDEATSTRIITGNDAKRRHSSLLTALGLAAERAGQPNEALALAEKVLADDPGFSPAVRLAARRNLANDRPKAAERVIERAWSENPHPDLVGDWQKLAPAGDATAAARWMERLKKLQPGSVEAALAYATAAIDARLWTDARQELEPLAAVGNNRACALLGHLEREEKGSLAAAVQWYERASNGITAEADWICHACGHRAAGWSELCPACGAFAQLQAPDSERRDNKTPQKPVSLPGIGMPLVLNDNA